MAYSVCAGIDISKNSGNSNSYISPVAAGYHNDNEVKEKQQCTYVGCGKTIKDLKAHHLTHQTKRPEKCPITTCKYHIKGFARKYDRNRQVLTHYKGNKYKNRSQSFNTNQDFQG